MFTRPFRRPLGGLFLAVALAACDDAPAPKATASTPKETTAPAVETVRLGEDELRRAALRTETLALASHREIVPLFGTVEPNRDRLARVLPPIAGRLTRVTANLGDRFEQGDLLAVLDSPELGELRAAHYQAQTELNLARAANDRAQRLVADGSIAQKEALRARSDLEKAQAGLNVAAAKLATLGVPATVPAGVSPTALAVPAPFAGTVVEKPAVLGEYAQAYQPLFSIADLTSLWIEVTIYDRDIGDVAIGAPATVAVSAHPDRRFTGKVTYISNLLDRETRTVKARVEVADPDGHLKPGMFANVLIEKPTSGRSLRVPEAALTLLYGQLTAFVATSDATGEGFVPRPVEAGERVNGRVTILSGLVPGDRVVTSGVYALKARLLSAQLAAK